MEPDKINAKDAQQNSCSMTLFLLWLQTWESHFAEPFVHADKERDIITI